MNFIGIKSVFNFFKNGNTNNVMYIYIIKKFNLFQLSNGKGPYIYISKFYWIGHEEERTLG